MGVLARLTRNLNSIICLLCTSCHYHLVIIIILLSLSLLVNSTCANVTVGSMYRVVSYVIVSYSPVISPRLSIPTH